MERILNPIDFLKASVIIPDPNKLEMDLAKLLKKEEFNRLLRGEIKNKENWHGLDAHKDEH